MLLLGYIYSKKRHLRAPADHTPTRADFNPPPKKVEYDVEEVKQAPQHRAASSRYVHIAPTSTVVL